MIHWVMQIMTSAMAVKNSRIMLAGSPTTAMASPKTNEQKINPNMFVPAIHFSSTCIIVVFLVKKINFLKLLYLTLIPLYSWASDIDHRFTTRGTRDSSLLQNRPGFSLKNLVSRVNFINILRSRFLYKSKLSSFFLITFGFAIFWRQNIGEKVACKKFLESRGLWAEKDWDSWFATKKLN